MKKIFIDTNIWLRYLVEDDKTQFKYCQKVIQKIEAGKIRSYTSVIVLMEIAYTLSTFYGIKKRQIVDDIKDILSTRNLTLIEKTDFKSAFDIFSKHSIKLADCLIATQLARGVVLCTYDREFKTIKSLVSQTPEEILI